MTTTTRSGYTLQPAGVVAQQVIKRSTEAIRHDNERATRSPLTPHGREIVLNTIAHLRLCKKARAEGYPCSFTSDATWLVQQAINRRACWPDDPGCSRGSCRPVNGKYPAKAQGETFNHLQLLAYRLNTPRLIIRETELGEWRKLILSRMPNRIMRREDY